MKNFEIWIKRVSSHNSNFVTYLGKHDANCFEDACEIALKKCNYDMSYYNKISNTYWGCKLYDNSSDATTKSF